MPTISPTLPNDGETIDAQDVNGPFNAILGVLNGNIDGTNVKPGSLPWSVMDSFSEQIPASAMQKSGNLELFRQHAKISFIPDGLVWSALTGLNAGMTSGQYYSNSGILLPITAVTSRAFTASRDTYVSIGQNGSLGYSEVANNAAQPALPSNSNWLAKVVTNGSAVTGVTDMRQTAPIASHNVDFTSLTHLRVQVGSSYSAPANGSKIQLTNIIFDTQKEFNTSTYLFTAKKAGTYLVIGRYWWGSAGAGTDEGTEAQLVLNGSTVFAASDRLNGSGNSSRLLRPLVVGSIDPQDIINAKIAKMKQK